jgi:hypothetical protein
MRFVLRREGAVTVARPDWSVVRVVIGTGSGPPSWPVTDDRLRVLVEGTAGRWRGEDAARDAGMNVVSCPGPYDRLARCPAFAGRPCPLAHDAPQRTMRHTPSVAELVRRLREVLRREG